MIEVDFSVGGYYYYRIQVCLDLRILDESGAGCTVLARTVLCLGVHHAVDNADGCSRMDRRLNCGAQLHKRTHTLTHSLTHLLTHLLLPFMQRSGVSSCAHEFIYGERIPGLYFV